MKASEMTNEELANELNNVLVNDELQAFADVERQQEAVEEATARLRKYDGIEIRMCQIFKPQFEMRDAIIADLRVKLKIAEAALKKCAKVQYDGYDDSISCEECDLSCDGRCAQWTAKRALSAIRGT